MESIADCLILPAAFGIMHYTKQVIPLLSLEIVDLKVLMSSLLISRSGLIPSGSFVPGLSISIKNPYSIVLTEVVTALYDLSLLKSTTFFPFL